MQCSIVYHFRMFDDIITIILSLQIKFSPEPEKFILDDGYQPPATLTSPSREILGATFYKYVLKNIGMYTTEIDLGSKHQI